MNEEYEIAIDRYINGDMTPSEKKDFKILLEKDSEIAEAYKATLMAHKLIYEAGRMELKDTLKSFESDTRTGTSVRRFKLNRLLPIAASLVVLIGVTMFFNFSGSMTNEEAYDTFYEPYDAPSVKRENIDQNDSDWNKAVTYYNRGEFDKALQYLEVADGDVHFTTIEFYQGMSYLQLDYPEYNDAAYYFNEVRLETSDYKEQANWYYALTLLKVGRVLEAKEVFKEIVSTRSFNHKKAKEILRLKLSD